MRDKRGGVGLARQMRSGTIGAVGAVVQSGGQRECAIVFYNSRPAQKGRAC